MSALVKKSLTDLTRRKARTAFAILTLAIAVASVGIFALPALADRMMQQEVRSTQLADLVVFTKPLPLDGEAARGARPAARTSPPSTAGRSTPRDAYVGERRVEDLRARRPRLREAAGRRRAPRRPARAPRAGEALTEVQNARQGTLRRRASATSSRVLGADGLPRDDRITGEGRNMARRLDAVSDGGAIVLYTTPATVADAVRHARVQLARVPARTTRAGRRRTRPSPPSRRYLRTHTAFTGFTDLPAVRAPGDWPGQDGFQKFSQLLYVLTALALRAGAGADREHDVHARRRADAGDRPDEGDRRHRPPDPGRSTCAPRSCWG